MELQRRTTGRDDSDSGMILLGAVVLLGLIFLVITVCFARSCSSVEKSKAAPDIAFVQPSAALREEALPAICRKFLANTRDQPFTVLLAPLREDKVDWTLDVLSNWSHQEEVDLAFRLLSGLGAREVESLVVLEDGRVWGIFAKRQQLKGSIPAELGKLTALNFLDFAGNQLTGAIPTEIGNLVELRFLDLSHNQLTGQIPQELGRLTRLLKLTLDYNKLTGPIPGTIGRLTELTMLKLEENSLSGPIPAEIGGLTSVRMFLVSQNQLTGWIPSEVGNLSSLVHLDLASNRLSGPIPATIGRLIYLQSLSLFDNQLTGPFPQEIGEQLPILRSLLLHKNFLEGKFPDRWRNPKGIAALTLHKNRFRGSLPRGLESMTNLRWFTVHGNYFSGTVPRLSLEHRAKATLHGNHFSCQLPESLRIDGLPVHATVVMGNMVGVGRNITANWVSQTELQDFLYVSSKVWWGNMFVLAGLPMAILGTGVIYCQSRQASARSTQVTALNIHASFMQSLRLSLWIAALCALLLPAYLHGARYYECGQPLARSTAAYLDESPLAELFVILVWSLATLFFSAAISVLPKLGEGVEPPDRPWQLKHRLAWLLWIVPVTMISLPSILYSVAQALPKDNTLVADSILNLAHRAAPALIVFVDEVLAARLSIKYAGLSGIKADRLLMALRLCAAWLLPLLAAVALQENCLAGWKMWWQTCDPNSEMHAAFNWWMVGTQASILNTTTDMCSADSENFWEGRCSRSVIEGLSPLILQKLLIRIAVQPFGMVLAWRASKLEDERPLDEGGRHLRLLGWGPKTSRSLDSMQQHAYFTTLLETAIVWGPLVPLVSFAVVAAFLSNAMLFEIGLSFGVRLPTNAANRGAALSRSYLRLALATSCVFQLWHAFGTCMAGRTMLLLTATLTAAVSSLGLPRVLRPASRPPRTGPEGLEMTEMEEANAEFPPLRIFLQRIIHS
ncbi:RLP19 [Symbiodinium sp. CCMP2456]|nr:RLP19 [Symbiodinium sp. CCMP2456]